MENPAVKPRFLKQFSFKELLVFATAFILFCSYVGKFIKRKLADKGKLDVYKAFRELPGPSSIPLLGIPWRALWDQDVLPIVLEWSKTYGTCYKVNLLRKDYVFVTSPEIIRAVLTSTDFSHLDKTKLQYSLLPEPLDSMFSNAGEKWSQRRTMLNHLFSYKSLREYNKSFSKHSANFVKNLDNLFLDGKVHSVFNEISMCIFKQTCETLVGVDISEMEGQYDKTFVQCVHGFFEMIASRIHQPWLLNPALYNLIYGKQFNDSSHMMRQICQMVTQHEIEKMRSCNANLSDDDDGDSSRKSVVRTMLENGESMDTIYQEVCAMFIAGLVTTSISAEMLLWLLALHPEYQRACQEEIDAIFKDPSKYHDGILEFDALTELKYLERCVLEGQRIYPGGTFARRLDTPLKINEDLVFPSGINVIFIPHTIHRNLEYFPDPETFDPDRFLPEEVRKRHRYAFVPFSGGPRSCIAMKLAMMELKVMVAKVLRTFDVSTTDKREDLKLVYQTVAHPEKPINFILTRRQNV